MLEDNSIDPKNFVKARWIKPRHRRSPEQRSGHMIFTFNNRDQANDVRIRGLIIHSQRQQVERLKEEPTRCLKCYKYGHIARNCNKKEEICSTCGAKGHRTGGCQEKIAKHCVSCNKNDHCSWNRSCPTFIKKCKEFDRKHPENTLPYFPSSEPWTWTSNNAPSITQKPKTQCERKAASKLANGEKTDTQPKANKDSNNNGNHSISQ